MEGEILDTESFIKDNIHTFQNLTNVRKGKAWVEIQNWNKDEKICEIGPLSIQSLENYHLYKYENTNKLSQLHELIRTEHMNEEEKYKILKLCKSYLDFFKKPNDKLSFSNNVKH